MANINETLHDLAQQYTTVFADSVINGSNAGKQAHIDGLPLQLPGNILLGEADIVDIATRYEAKKRGEDVDFPTHSDEVTAGVLGHIVGYVETRNQLHSEGVVAV